MKRIIYFTILELCCKLETYQYQNNYVHVNIISDCRNSQIIMIDTIDMTCKE